MADEANLTILDRFNGYSRQPVRASWRCCSVSPPVSPSPSGMVQWWCTPTYKPLYGAMAPEDTNDVIGALEANGIDYSLDRRSAAWSPCPAVTAAAGAAAAGQ
jgi:flagellar M-ring protein FliF